MRRKLVPNSRVFDNHLVIDPAGALFNRSDPEYQPLRRALVSRNRSKMARSRSQRLTCLNAMATSTSTKDVTWVFTDSQSSNALGSLSANDYYRAVKERGSAFFSIVLMCDFKENERRIQSTERSVRTKLTDVSILKTIRDDEDLYRFNDENELVLDITNLSVGEAARLIVDHVEAKLGREKQSR
jgi:hypothetical protein